MLVQMRRFTVTEGNAHQLVEKFTTQKAPVEGREGFIDKTVFPVLLA